MNPKTNFLEEITELKRARLEHARARHSLEFVRARAPQVRQGSQPHALRRALEPNGRLKIIAEIKRASPSKGVIKETFRPIEIAGAYSRGGAVAISVLTEENYFRGSLDDLRAVREASPLPILRKDFILDEYQIYESAEAGADALLLIVAALDDEQLSRFRHITEDELSMDALVEVHTIEELRRAERCGATLIGVNNRNLRTFEVSLNVSVNLAHEASPEALLVSESGLCSGDDLRRLQALGYKGFLIGEPLMRAADPAQALRKLIRDAHCNDRVRVKICGITNLNDAQVCVGAGADMLGFNFYPLSPRYIAPEEACRIIEQLPSETTSVGIFVNETSPEKVARIAAIAQVVAVQLHGEETPFYCQALKDRFVIKALRVQEGFKPEQISEYETEAILLDAFNSKARGGTGERFDWSIAQQARQFASKLFLAGGLTPENVTEAVGMVRPYAVDVCSSVESTQGQKDKRRVREFIAAARRSAKETAAVSE
jgi:indole-3-glycerol phosphate synthase/phosphoribosylanthranilate isomerase/anthranilate synthase/indole-3-glycerol phosphate synthase/phosphoribosylanthranilate isomerase